MKSKSLVVWEKIFSFFVALYTIFVVIYFFEHEPLDNFLSRHIEMSASVILIPLIFIFLYFFSRTFSFHRKKEALVSSADGRVTVSEKAIQSFVEEIVLSYDLVQSVLISTSISSKRVSIKIMVDLCFAMRTADLIKVIHARLKKELLSLLGYRMKIGVDLNVRHFASPYIDSNMSVQSEGKNQPQSSYVISSQVQGADHI